MRHFSSFSLFVIATALLSIFPATAARPADIDCTMCHSSLTDGLKVVHAAVQMGCPSCHSGIDAADVPHKKTNSITKGLSAEQPELCYGCHDKAKFTKKTVHAAVGMGCTGCHNPHASNKGKLLGSAVPDLCFNCHDKTEFSRKMVHGPVAGGMCLTCHDPHSSDYSGLLSKVIYHVCFTCHDKVGKQPHAIVGFSQHGHPVGLPKKARKGKKEALADIKDPKRPGKHLSCVSCHNPHSSEDIMLFRYPAKKSMDLCKHCHNR